MKMICDVPDEVIKCIKDGMWCGSHIVEKMITNGIPLSSSEELCEDAISKQAVNILVDELARAISDERCCMPRGRSTGAIMQDILDLPPVKSNSEKLNKWIPVSERLPEEKQSVLVWCPEYKNMYCAYLENKNWWIFGAFSQVIPNAVIAWMPLPEPYKAERSGEE